MTDDERIKSYYETTKAHYEARRYRDLIWIGALLCHHRLTDLRPWAVAAAWCAISATVIAAWWYR